MRPLITLLLLAIPYTNFAAGNRDEQVHKDRNSLQSSTTWIYNDLDRAFAEARAKNKPLLIVYRCIP